MKLDNRGWGLQAMLLCVLVLMIALVIIAVLVNQLGKTLGIEKQPIESETKAAYTDLENKVVEGAKKYHDKYYSDMQELEKITVTLKTLKNQRMVEDILDIKDKEKCTGYVSFMLEDGKTSYQAYLKCSNYTTKGYLDYLDI